MLNIMGHDELAKKLSLADVLHSENPLAVAADWIDEYQLEEGNYDVTKVDPELCSKIPTATQMGKVYEIRGNWSLIFQNDQSPCAKRLISHVNYSESNHQFFRSNFQYYRTIFFFSETNGGLTASPNVCPHFVSLNLVVSVIMCNFAQYL